MEKKGNRTSTVSGLFEDAFKKALEKNPTNSGWIETLIKKAQQAPRGNQFDKIFKHSSDKSKNITSESPKSN